MNDTDRLNLIENELLIIHPPAPTGDSFDGLWVVCDYTLPRLADYLSRNKDLRKAIDGAVGHQVLMRRRRCSAAVYKGDCYRVDRRAPGGFSMHYIRAQCKRPTVGVEYEFCWQHNAIADRKYAVYPEVAGYSEYMP